MLLLTCAPVAYRLRREIRIRSAYRAWVLSMPKQRYRTQRAVLTVLVFLLRSVKEDLELQYQETRTHASPLRLSPEMRQ